MPRFAPTERGFILEISDSINISLLWSEDRSFPGETGKYLFTNSA